MELGFSPLEDPHAGYLVEDSDLEYSDCCDENSSADEELEETRTHAIESRKKGQPGASQSCKEGSDDEFEREMEAEACLILQQAAATTSATTSAAGSSQPYDGAEGTSSSKKEFYNEVYFDSSDEEGEEHDGRRPESSTNDGRHKVKKLTNDELFYDPQLDEEDEKWVRRQRLSYHNVRLSEELQRHKKTSSNPSCSQSAAAVTAAAADDAKGFPLTDQVPQSDAVLNCPACMTILCRDCQRHEVFHSQYRAMLVVNCTTVTEERLTYTHKPDKKSRKRRHHQQQQQQPLQEGDLYYPVRCTHCNTEVAVYDNDEVYHFFNVLASAP